MTEIKIITLNELCDIEAKQLSGKVIVFICETLNLAEKLLNMGLQYDKNHPFYGSLVYWCDMSLKTDKEKLH